MSDREVFKPASATMNPPDLRSDLIEIVAAIGAIPECDLTFQDAMSYGLAYEMLRGSYNVKEQA